MRQPTNLRGATLPGLSQPSEKEGPHHRSLSACQKLQWRADSPLQSHPFTLLFLLPGSGEAKFKLRSPDDWATPVTLAEEERRQASSQVSQNHLRFSLLCVRSAAQPAWSRCSETHCGSRLATEPEAWHLNCPGNIAAHCRVGSINQREFWGPTRQTQTWQEVRGVGVKIPQVRHHFRAGRVRRQIGNVGRAQNEIGQITELGICDFQTLRRTRERLETNRVYVSGRRSKWNHLTPSLTFQEGYAVNGEILTGEEWNRTRHSQHAGLIWKIFREKIFS